MGLPRLRTAAGVIEEIKKIDPGTDITLNYIRGIIRNNSIPVTCAGRKKLVNLDLVLEHLTNGVGSTPKLREPGIRQVQA